MLILAIETSTQICSLALLQDRTLLAEWYVQSGRTHSTGIMDQLAGLLSRSKIDKKELTAIAVNIGPGSFTGLRIGLSLAKSLAIALNIPVVGIPSDEALAYLGELSDNYVATLIDAQRNTYYYSLYRWQDGAPQQISATVVLPYTEIKTILAGLDRKVLTVGEYKTELFEGGTNILTAPQHLMLPRATNLALAAQLRLSQGRSDSPYTLAVNYIKPSEAERVWLLKQQTANK